MVERWAFIRGKTG